MYRIAYLFFYENTVSSNKTFNSPERSQLHGKLTILLILNKENYSVREMQPIVLADILVFSKRSSLIILRTEAQSVGIWEQKSTGK